MKLKETFSIIIITFLALLFFNINKTEVQFVKSSIDEKFYIVRNMPDKDKAANMLAKIKKNLIKLVESLQNNSDKEMKEYIQRIADKIYTVEIKENSANNNYTSYSVNKGEELVFCIRSKIDHKLHNLNLIMYVAIHEIAHIGCPELDHTPLFNKINKYLLDHAIKINLYYPQDFNLNPVEYCGMTLNSHI